MRFRNAAMILVSLGLFLGFLGTTDSTLAQPSVVGYRTIFFEDFDDNSFDQFVWVATDNVGPFEDPFLCIMEQNRRLEFNLKKSGNPENFSVTSTQSFTGESVFEADFQNGTAYNYLYKGLVLQGEYGNKTYITQIRFRDAGPINLQSTIREGGGAINETVPLYTGNANNWNWLFHLTLTRNADGTISATVTDDKGHYFKKTGTLIFPLESALHVQFNVTLWKFGSPRLVWFDNAKVSVPIIGVVARVKDDGMVNPRSNGVTPVAILTTAVADDDQDDFDATTVDPLSVRFGPGEAAIVHGAGHMEDVDDDGDMDLLLHFRTQETGIQCGATAVTLTGETTTGALIAASIPVRTAGCRSPKALTKGLVAAGSPDRYALYQNHPNPFNPETHIRFDLPDEDHVRITIFSILGKEIRTLANGFYEAGMHTVRWDGRDNSGIHVPTGMYLCQLSSPQFVRVMKMSLLR